MDPSMLAALSQLGEGLGGLVGNYMAKGDYAKARKLLEEVNAEAGPSAFENVEGDPVAKDYQLRALDSIYSTARAGGMDPASKARLREASNEVAAANNGAQGRIVQNYAMRGNGGGGSELAARLAAGQGSANAQAAAGTSAAGDANMRALTAMNSAGGLASNVRGQSWQENSGKAQAQDVMSRFNAGQRLDKAGMVAGVYNQDAERKKKAAAGGGGLLGGVGGLIGGFSA